MGYRHLRVKPFDIVEPAQLRAASQQGRCSRRHAETHRLAQREAAVEVQNDARQHAVARADRAFRLHRHRRKALAPLRARQQSTSRTERNDDDLAAALRDHLSRRLLFFAFATDLPPRKILELAKARLQQIDAMAGLFERRTRGVQHEALCLPLRQRCDTRIEILGNANRQAAAGDDIIRLRRRPRKLVEAAFLIRC